MNFLLHTWNVANAMQCTVLNSNEFSIEELDCSLSMTVNSVNAATAVHYYYRINSYDNWHPFPQILLMEQLNRQIWLKAIVAHNKTDSEALVLCDGPQAYPNIYTSPRILYTYRSISFSHIMNPTCGAPWLAYVAISIGIMVGLLILCVCSIRCFNTEFQFQF